MKSTLISERNRTRALEALASGKSFILYRKPDCAPKYVDASNTERSIRIVPWCQRFNEVVPVSNGGDKLAPTYSLPDTTPREQYLANAEQLISRLKERKHAKTVLSRVIRGSSQGINWVDAAEKLWNEFPNSFGFLFYTPQHGGWIGATPEKLLIVYPPNHFTTHSLAGTLPVDEPWNLKNYEEQQMVTSFIESVLDEQNLSYKTSEQRDLRYGKIKHLSTTVTGQFNENTTQSALTNLLDSLAPTPALSGFPRAEAIEDIRELEAHQRGCYGGYIAVCEDDMQNVSAFVTIRCAQFDPETNQWAIYAGGGLTPKSDPVTEWNETEYKASKMLDILTI